MAEGKTSFIFYTDWKATFESLPDEKAGELIKHLLRYVNDEDPQTDDLLINAVFAGFKSTLKRDLSKWEKYIEKQRENGKRGGRPKKAKKPNPFSENPSQPKKADSVSVSVNNNNNNNVAVTKNGEAAKNPYERERPDVDNARDVLAEIQNNAQWWDMLSRKVRKDADPKKLLNEFIAHNRLHEKGDMRYKDFKSYFRNWINKQIELKNKELEKLLIYP